MNVFVKFFASLRLREAIKRANEAHELNGHRYYVMPMDDHSGKLLVIDRQYFRRFKQKKYINDNARVMDLINESFYFTPYANGDGRLAEYDRLRKVEQLFVWTEACRKKRKLYGKKKSLLRLWHKGAKAKH